MKVSIIIPNYNGSELLKKNLPFVYEALEYHKKKTGDDYELIVTDDASTDSSASVVSSLRIPITYVEREKNGGYSSNVNSGVEHASGDFLVLLNTDVRPERDFLMPLLEHFSNDDVFAVGCMDKSIEHGKVKFRGRGIGRWEKGFMLHHAGDITKTNTLWASGGSSAFRKKIWDKLGGLYTIYDPFYWEDIDLSYRALKAGYTVLFESKSVVVHEHELGAIKKQFSSAKITSVAYRNQFLFIWLNITDARYVVSHLGRLPFTLLSAMIRRDKNYLSGFTSALRLLPKAFSLRFHNMKLFRKSDSWIFSTIRI